MSLQITIGVALVLWIILGFIGFFMEAKIAKYTKFDKEAREEFFVCILLGLVTFLCFVSQLAWKRFIDFMDKALWKLNCKEHSEEGTEDK